MKKIVLTLAALMTLTFANAESTETNANSASVAQSEQKSYDMTVNYRRLGTLLDLDFDQMSGMQLVHNRFIKDMDEVAGLPEQQRAAKLNEAVSNDFKYMRYVLNDKQYSKYETLINTTLRNRGLIK